MTRLAVLMISTAIACASSSVRAGLSAPIPFAILSKDESKILVIRDGGSGFSKSQIANPRLSGGEIIDFLTAYPRSGVYEVASKQLDYPIDWFSLEREVLASDDLAYVARLNRFGGDWALKFYAHGAEVRTYKVDELLTGFADERFRPFVTWDYFHPWHDEFELRDGHVVLTTVNREVFGVPIGFREIHTFQLATGSLQNTEVQNGPMRLLIGGVGLLIIIITSVFLAVRAQRRESKRQTKSCELTGDQQFGADSL